MITVRFEIEHMKQQMLQAFTEYQDAFEKESREAIEEAVKNFDYKAEIDKMIVPMIRNAMNNALRATVDPIVEKKMREISGEIFKAHMDALYPPKP